MYTFLVNNDNTITTTIKERIVQRSKLVDKIHILIPVNYKGVDMTDFEVTMFYKLPVSKEEYTITLTSENELYKDDFLEYKINGDTWLTKEAGTVEFNLTISKVEISEDSQVTQYVRKVTGGEIVIASCNDWGSGLADNLLQTIDQRIIQLQMVAKQIDEANQNLYDIKADSITYNGEILTLLGNGNELAEVNIKNCECEGNDDGIKVVEF